MRLRKSVAGIAALALSGVALVNSPFTPVSAEGAVPEYTVGLHNTDAGVAPCPTGVTNAWHFVAPPKSATDFIAITLVLDGDTVVIDDWLEFPLTGDAYVTVPDGGYTLDSLEGGTFVITGSTQNVRLSHVCAGSPPDNTPPNIEVTKTAEVTYIEEYDWTIEKDLVGVVPHASSADLTYEIDVTRTGPVAVAGSYVVTGTITVANLSSTKAALLVGLTDVLDSGETCTLDEPFESDSVLPLGSIVYGYTCEIAGVPVYDTVNTATAALEYGDQEFSASGTASVGITTATVRDTLDETATVTDTRAGALGTVGDSTSFTYTMDAVPAGGTNCYPGYENTATVTEDDTDESDSDTATIELCTTTGGHTIGYWFASPAGNAATWAALPSLKAQYPSILATVNPTTAKKLKDFGANANCSGDCKTMLQAQFIATAMSVRTQPDSFDDQCVYLPGGGTITIEGLLVQIDAEWGLGELDTAERVAYKNLLDAINNNVALACID